MSSFYVVVSDRLGGRFAIRAKTEKEADFVLHFHKSKDANSVEIYRQPFHSTTDQRALVKFYGNGSYWDNVSKENPKINEKRVE